MAVITFGDEIELIWKGKWTPVTILFVLNRYYLLALVLFNSYVLYNNGVTDEYNDDFGTDRLLPLLCRCTRYYQWEGWTELAVCMLSQGILQIRTYALYLLNKKVLAILLAMYSAALFSSAYILVQCLKLIKVTATPIPGGTFCVPTSRVQGFYAFWIPLFIFDCFLCALTIYRSFCEFKTSGSIVRRSRNILAVLLRDSVFYLVTIAVVYLISVIFWDREPLSLADAPTGFAPAISGILANRVVLNVRSTFKETSSVSLVELQETTAAPGINSTASSNV
ncbi:hypothetical protein D9613_012920 [Agrocybe pediades]|uniref:DUF6533 domain-containing protein n=1 Tax=Agrocybe pediades TaxID=84607 RepID=A0A8H4VHM6_9AGAR|nr:hypothetical protein D9613_012920 [Agrocybe pediades]